MSHPYVDIHTHRSSQEGIAIRSFEVGDSFIGSSSLGVHPYRLGAELVISKGVIAVGEIGLDYSILPLDKQAQQRAFSDQLAVAEKHDLPVVIHCVRAYNDVISILKNYKLKAVIFHGFLSNDAVAQTLASKGYYISLGHRSLASQKTIEAVKNYPQDRIFLETDDTDIPISDIYLKASHIFAWDLEDLKQQIFTNYKRIFNE